MDIATLYSNYRRIRALVETLEVIEEKLATDLVVAKVAGQKIGNLAMLAATAKKWLDYGYDCLDAAKWDLDRHVECHYDGTIPANILADCPVWVRVFDWRDS